MKKLISKLIRPRAKDEEIQRREYILNVLLFAITLLSLFATARVAVDYLLYGESKLTVPFPFFVLLTFFFIFLFYLSKKGKVKISALVLIFSILVPLLAMAYIYGAELPQGLLTFSLLIIMSSVLVSTRFSIYLGLFISAYLIILAYLQTMPSFAPDSAWRTLNSGFSDTFVAVITLLVITTISWLSNREIEKSLKRARKSETELRKERDTLEERVAERTRELKEAEAEKIAQVSRFAEFGRISAGIFHDLLNTVTGVSINLEELKDIDKKDLKTIKSYLNNAVEANSRMINYIGNIKKQLQQQEIMSSFNINDEIKEAIGILSYKALKNHVIVKYKPTLDFNYYGNPLQLHQALTNLISNSIDSYEKSKSNNKEVVIDINESKDSIEIKVADTGAGIKKEDLDKIFDPFFTTKGTESGMGIGLPLTKETIEKVFGGTLTVESKLGKGSAFTISLPKVKKTTSAKTIVKASGNR